MGASTAAAMEASTAVEASATMEAACTMRTPADARAPGGCTRHTCVIEAADRAGVNAR
jgi:hypothetical protein